MPAKEFIVKSVWNGMVGVPDKVVNEARNYGKDLLLILSKQERMNIKHGSLTSSIVNTSSIKYRDKFRGESYYLIYFRWEIDPPEQYGMGL